MKSKGGKIEYVCGQCNSPSIKRCGTVIRNVEDGCVEILGMYAARDDSYYCSTCGNFECWLQRGKRSLKKPLPDIEVCRVLPENDPRHAHRVFYNHDSYVCGRIVLGTAPDFTMV